MKAVTLYQPWASLVALRFKKYETRSWCTPYRGKIAIHAAIKKFDINELDRETVYKMREVLFPEHSIYDDFSLRCHMELPHGAVVATADLVACWHIESAKTATDDLIFTDENSGERKLIIRNGFKEIHFGDFRPGRYAWELANVKMLEKPITAKGLQRIWNWNEEV